MKPQVVSTRWTMLFKLLVPTFFLLFFGGIAVGTLFVDLDVQAPFTPTSARIMLFTFVLSVWGILYLLFMRIKWVALDESHIYVSNFFKVYRYTYDSISGIDSTSVLWWKKVTVHFYSKGYFGSSIQFIPSAYWAYFLDKHPEVMEQIAASTANAMMTEEEEHNQ